MGPRIGDRARSSRLIIQKLSEVKWGRVLPVFRVILTGKQ